MASKTTQQLGTLMMAAGIIGLYFWSVQSQKADKVLNSQESGQRPSQRQECRVLTVYDGDTLGCDLNGDGKVQKPQEQVRLLGIDTPEMHYSKKNIRKSKQRGESIEDIQDEPFAREASLYVKKQVEDKLVYLEFDQQRHDRYGRTLAYVYESSRARKTVSEKLLDRGFATILMIKPNYRYKQKFTDAETKARQEGKGLWRSSE